jgi:hypothetical protein
MNQHLIIKYYNIKILNIYNHVHLFTLNFFTMYLYGMSKNEPFNHAGVVELVM